MLLVNAKRLAGELMEASDKLDELIVAMQLVGGYSEAVDKLYRLRDRLENHAIMLEGDVDNEVALFRNRKARYLDQGGAMLTILGASLLEGMQEAKRQLIYAMSEAQDRLGSVLIEAVNGKLSSSGTRPGPLGERPHRHVPRYHDGGDMQVAEGGFFRARFDRQD